MATATTTAKSQLRSLIECSVCLEIFNDPRILPCQHSFCLRCLQNTWASKQPKDAVHCLLCREMFVIPEAGICGIRKDHRVKALIDVYDRETAYNAHFCAEHKDKALDIYCSSCETDICSSCLIKNHSDHRVSNKGNFLDVTRKQIANELLKLSGYEDNMRSRKNELEAHDNKFLMEIEEAEILISKQAAELKQMRGNRELIEQQRLALVEELCVIKQKQLKEIAKEKEEMENHLAEIQSIRQLCNTIALIEDSREIYRVMAEFHTTSNKLADNHQVQMEHKLTSTKFSFHPKAQGELKSGRNCIGSITAVTMRYMYIKRLDVSSICGLTKLRSNIYVLRNHSGFTISVYDDEHPFCLQAEIHIKEIKIAEDIASSEKSKCLYVTDSVNNCIWKITVDDHRVTRWLSHIGDPFTLSVTSDGHILNLRDGNHRCRLEIYGSDAKLIRNLILPIDIQWPLHAVQKPSGQFITMHKAKPGNGGPWFISQLTSDGEIVSRYHFLDGLADVTYPWHISLDFQIERLFLASCHVHGIILLDSTSDNWNKMRLTEIESASCEDIYCDCSWQLAMHYDTSKKQLLITRPRPTCTSRNSLLIVELS